MNLSECADGKEEEVAAVTRNPAAAALPGAAHHVVGGDPSRPQPLMRELKAPAERTEL